MKQRYIDTTFRAQSLAQLTQINGILGEYRAQGFVLTLRQLYYQLVARDLISNDLRSYKRIVNLVGKGRLAGLIDWAMLTDRNRKTVTPSHWLDPAEIIDAAIDSFAINKWEEQPYHVEVVCEKDALSSILEPICHQLDVRFTAAKGYNSLSNMREMGLRLRTGPFATDPKTPIVIYLGDHDPSGLDMIRDVYDRLGMFAGDEVEVQHLALTRPQIEQYDPPENPAKTSDSRYAAYAYEHGTSSWELDALEPQTLSDLLTAAVEDYRDEALWQSALARQEEMRAQLVAIADDLRSE